MKESILWLLLSSIQMVSDGTIVSRAKDGRLQRQDLIFD